MQNIPALAEHCLHAVCTFFLLFKVVRLLWELSNDDDDRRIIVVSTEYIYILLNIIKTLKEVPCSVMCLMA
jgi:hypothetical protein